MLTDCIGATEFRFEQGATVLQPFGPVATHDVTPAASDLFTVRVRCDAMPGCESSASTPITVIADARPSDLGNSLRSIRAGGDIPMSWASVPEARTYSLYRALSKGIWPPPIASMLGTTTHRVADVASPPDLYYYRVVGVSCSGLEGP